MQDVVVVLACLRLASARRAIDLFSFQRGRFRRSPRIAMALPRGRPSIFRKCRRFKNHHSKKRAMLLCIYPTKTIPCQTSYQKSGYPNRGPCSYQRTLAPDPSDISTCLKPIEGRNCIHAIFGLAGCAHQCKDITQDVENASAVRQVIPLLA